VDCLLEELNGLSASDWPMVIMRGDLVKKNNIRFDSNIANRKGVIEWNDAVVALFVTSARRRGY